MRHVVQGGVFCHNNNAANRVPRLTESRRRARAAGCSPASGRLHAVPGFGLNEDVPN